MPPVPYKSTGLITLFYTFILNFNGIILSRVTLSTSLHLYHASFILWQHWTLRNTIVNRFRKIVKSKLCARLYQKLLICLREQKVSPKSLKEDDQDSLRKTRWSPVQLHFISTSLCHLRASVEVCTLCSIEMYEVTLCLIWYCLPWQKHVEQFAALTNTDEACAQFYLQDRQWNLEVGRREVCAYSHWQ